MSGRIGPPRPTEMTFARRRVVDWRAYFATLERGARAGRVDACVALASWLMDGLTIARSTILRPQRRRAFRMLLAAAEAGNAAAFAPLARAYDEGLGTRRSAALERHWYERAAASGCASSALDLACIARDDRRFADERRWLRRAHALGDPDAALRLHELDLESDRHRARAKAALTRALRSRAASARAEAREILEHWIATGRRRWR